MADIVLPVRILATILVVASVAVAPALAADDDAGQPQPAPRADGKPGFQAGYGDVPQFGGPDGVSGQLRKSDVDRESMFQWQAPQRWFKPWYDWKGNIQDDHGLAMGFFFSVLGQKASDSTTNDDDALGGLYRFQGSWTLVNRGGKDPGRIEWRIENRSNIGSFQALSGGFEYIVRPDQAWTFGVGWAEPAKKPSGTKDEYVIETSYKFQLAKNFSLLPDLQVLIDPRNNPSESEIWVFSLRAILTL